MSITNRLKFWRTSAAKSIGAAAALAVFAGFLTPSSASATADDIDVVMYIDGLHTAKICVNFRNNDGLADQVTNGAVGYDPDHYGYPTDVQSRGDDSNDYDFITASGLSLDTANSSWNTNSVPAYTLSYIGTSGVDNGPDDVDCDLKFGVSNISVFDWNEINFKYRAWTENGNSADAVHEGSTAFGQDPDDATFSDLWDDDIYTPQNVYHYSWYDNEGDFDGAVGLANRNNDIQDERHTAFFCLSNNMNNWDNNNDWWDWEYWANIENAEIRVWDQTTEEYVTSDMDISTYFDEDFPYNESWSDDCGNYEMGWTIEGLTLGHTYNFEAAVQSYYRWWQEWDEEGYYTLFFDQYQWDTYESEPFTPLDVRQNQKAVYEQNNNEGCDGPYCGEGWAGEMDGNYWTNIIEGDGISIFADGSYSANIVQYTNVDVALPASASDYYEINNNGSNLGVGYLDTDGYFYLLGDAGDEDSCEGYCYWIDDESYSFAEFNGGQYRQGNGYWSNTFYADYANFGSNTGWDNQDVTDNSLSYSGQAAGMQQTGVAGYMRDFQGQAFVAIEDLEYDGDNVDGTFEGLADTYSAYNQNNSTNWYSESARALSDTSVEVVFDTQITTEQYNIDGVINNVDDANAHTSAANATYYVRAVPNYGHNADSALSNYGNDGWVMDPWSFNEWGQHPEDDNFSGNEDNRQNRYGVIDYVFNNQDEDETNDFTLVGNTDCRSGWGNTHAYCYRNGTVRFNLNGLQPGTTYSVEIRTVAPYVDDAHLAANLYEHNSYVYTAAGDGGWLNAEYRRGFYALATTYLSAAAQNVTRTSADVAVNMQNSHMVDVVDAQQAAYVAVNKCNSFLAEEEGPDAACYTPIFGNADTNQNDPQLTWTGENEPNWWYNRFDMTEVSRYPVTRTEYVDGQLSAIVHLTQLSADTGYEVVFGMDYWPTGAQLSAWGWTDGAGDQWLTEVYQGSHRKVFVDTLDGSYCDGLAAQHDSSDCYNGASNNNIYRTAVVYFRTGDADMIDPTLGSITPENDATDVSVDSDISLVFSENVVRGSVGHFIKVWNADTASVAYTVDVTSAAVSGSGDEWSVSLPDLNYSTHYYVTIDSGAFADAAGNTYKGLAGASASFTTESTDEEGPVLESIGTVSTWQDGRADTDTTITLNFDENVVKGLGVVEIRKSSNSQVVKTIVPAIYKNIAIDGEKVTITLSGVLDYSTEYFVYVAPEAFSDESGNLYGGNAGEIFNEDKPASFTTQDKPDLLGTVTVSKSDANHYRKYVVNYGAAGAFLAVKLYRKDRHTGVYRYMATVYLDDKGQGSIKLQTLHLMQYDFVVGRVGNHMTSFTIVMSA